MINRRTFLTATAATLVVGAAARAQERPRRMAYVIHQGPVTAINKGAHPDYGNLLEELEELGWIEGETLTIERYLGDGNVDEYPTLAETIVRTNPDLIYSRGQAQLLNALTAATSTILNVASTTTSNFSRLTDGLARPGGNLTGTSTDAGREIAGKRMQLLRDAVPSVARIAYIHRRRDWDENFPVTVAAREAATLLGLTLVPALLDPPVTEETYRRIFASFADNAVDGLLVGATAENNSFTRTITQLAAEARVPGVYPYRTYAVVGGLICYGPDHRTFIRRGAHYIDRIFKGDDPAVLPIEQPTLFDFVINLKTARELGIEFPLKILLGATEVIE